jgi:hypothetical protein
MRGKPVPVVLTIIDHRNGKILENKKLFSSVSSATDFVSEIFDNNGIPRNSKETIRDNLGDQVQLFYEGKLCVTVHSRNNVDLEVPIEVRRKKFSSDYIVDIYQEAVNFQKSNSEVLSSVSNENDAIESLKEKYIKIYEYQHIILLTFICYMKQLKLKPVSDKIPSLNILERLLMEFEEQKIYHVAFKASFFEVIEAELVQIENNHFEEVKNFYLNYKIDENEMVLKIEEQQTLQVKCRDFLESKRANFESYHDIINLKDLDKIAMMKMIELKDVKGFEAERDPLFLKNPSLSKKVTPYKNYLILQNKMDDCKKELLEHEEKEIALKGELENYRKNLKISEKDMIFIIKERKVKEDYIKSLSKITF